MYFKGEKHTADFQAQIDQNLKLMREFGATILDGVEKLTELNIAASREMLSEVNDSLRSSVDVKNPGDVFSQASGTFTPNMERFVNYGQKAQEIGEGVRTQLASLAEGYLKSTADRATKLAKDLSVVAPGISEGAVGVMLQAMEKSMEGVTKVGEAVKNATDSLSAATKKSSKK